MPLLHFRIEYGHISASEKVGSCHLNRRQCARSRAAKSIRFPVADMIERFPPCEQTGPFVQACDFRQHCLVELDAQGSSRPVAHLSAIARHSATGAQQQLAVGNRPTQMQVDHQAASVAVEKRARRHQ